MGAGDNVCLYELGLIPLVVDAEVDSSLAESNVKHTNRVIHH